MKNINEMNKTELQTVARALNLKFNTKTTVAKLREMLREEEKKVSEKKEEKKNDSEKKVSKTVQNQLVRNMKREELYVEMTKDDIYVATYNEKKNMYIVKFNNKIIARVHILRDCYQIKSNTETIDSEYHASWSYSYETRVDTVEEVLDTLLAIREAREEAKKARETKTA